jgi:hypothetical protein
MVLIAIQISSAFPGTSQAVPADRLVTDNGRPPGRLPLGAALRPTSDESNTDKGLSSSGSWNFIRRAATRFAGVRQTL